MDNTESACHKKKNLIMVERSNYFPSKEYYNRHKSYSLLKRDDDESFEDGTLTSSLKVLERLHYNFFAKQVLTCRMSDIYRPQRIKKVLAGCCILFSGFFRCEEPNPHKPPTVKALQTI